MGFSHHQDKPSEPVFIEENNEWAFEIKEVAIIETYEDSAADVQSERQPDENMKTAGKEENRSSPPKESKNYREW